MTHTPTYPMHTDNQLTFSFRAARITLLGFLVLLLAACSTVVKVSQPDAPLMSLAQAERGYAAVQKDTSASGIRALESYVQAIAITPIEAAASPEARLAHMVNAYNALSMFNVIASGIPPTHAGWAKVKFFLLRKFEIGGTLLSLYAFENDIIRKLGEPRIPVLPRKPFTADQLNQELDRETRAFFMRPENVVVDHAKRTVFFNEILKFYTEDFTPAHAPSLIDYAQRYTSQALPKDYGTAFTPYDWTVANSQRQR
jgi:Protein of unknown function, DUF547